MHSVTEIKVKTLNQGKNPDRGICLEVSTFFQNKSHNHGRSRMTPSRVSDHDKVKTNEISLK